MAHRLLILGAGSALPRPGLGCSGYAIVRPDGGVVLIDLGPGSLRELARHDIGVERVVAVLFSHEHTDHCADLLHLLFARRNPSLASCPDLELVGPRGLAALVERSQNWLVRSGPPPGVTVRELDPAAPGQDVVGGIPLEYCATGHTENALAYALVLGDCFRLVYSGDCGDPQRIAVLARHADLLLCECSAPDDAPLEGHLTPRDVAWLAQAAEPSRVLLTHFYPDLDPCAAVSAVATLWGGEVAAARDGLGLGIDRDHIDGWPE